MKVNLMDSKLRNHFVDVADDSVSIAHVRELLEQKFPVPTGFFPQLVYQKQILTGQDSLGASATSQTRVFQLFASERPALHPCRSSHSRHRPYLRHP